jgi:hypothetical protein
MLHIHVMIIDELIFIYRKCCNKKRFILSSSVQCCFKHYKSVLYFNTFIINNAQLVHFSLRYQSRDSSVGIALGYGLDDRGSRVRFLAGAGNFSLHHRVQNGSAAHPASYTMRTRGSFLGDKAAGA